jgi:hypothetical protein
MPRNKFLNIRLTKEEKEKITSFFGSIDNIRDYLIKACDIADVNDCNTILKSVTQNVHNVDNTALEVVLNKILENTEILVNSNAKKRTIFKPPTIEEITDYCLERKNNLSPKKIFDFYEAKNWMIGKNKMKDWKAAVRNWENNNKTNNANGTGRQSFIEISEGIARKNEKQGFKTEWD